MKRVVVKVDQALQDIYIGVCVGVCEIPPHFTLQGGIEPFGQRTFNVAVLSSKESDSSFIEKLLEMFVEEFFSFVGLNVHVRPLFYHGFESFSDVFPRLGFDSLSEGKPGEDIYGDHDVRVPFVVFF